MSFLKALKSFADNQKEISSKKILEWQKAKIEEYGNQLLKHQPIFIIGAPRTGSTILYQTITNLYDVLYVDNLVCKFHQNFFFGFWLSDKIYGNQPHNNYEADHGNTHMYGLHAPSECGQFWYRWLPKDHHYIEADEIPDKKLEEIKKEITAVVNYFDKPLVFGNNNAGLRLNMLNKIFPNAKYIMTLREPLSVVSSLLKARKKFYGSYEKWWSLMPSNHIYLKQLDFAEQVVMQYFWINKNIKDDIKNLDKTDCLSEVEHKKFCEDFDGTIRVLEDFMSMDKKKICVEFPKLNYKLNIIGDKKIENKLKEIINSLDFNDYTI